ncbi:hypothetical protein GC175_32525 [bacterium]|nr:hypothetical protein [bacterium]
MKGSLTFASPYQRVILLAALVVALILGTPQPTQAATSVTCIWVGSVDSDWHNASNWDCAAVPTSSDTVIVPDVANDPVLSADGTALSLTVDADATVTVGATFVLTVAGTFAGDGEVTGTLRFAGCAVTANFAGAVEDLIIEMTPAGFNCGSVMLFQQAISVTGNLTLEGAAQMNGSQIAVSGDVVSNDTDGYRSFQSATTVISLVGSDDQTISGAGALMFVDVNKPSGVVILPNEFPLNGFGDNGGNGELSGTGTISGTLRMTGCQYQSDFAGTVTNLVINMTPAGFNCGSVMLFQQAISVTGNLTLEGAAQMNGSQIVVSGDVVSNDTDGYRSFQSATTVVSLVGSDDQTISGAGALMYVNVNKPSGVVILPNEFPFSGFANNGGDAELTGTGTISGTLRLTGCRYRSNFAGTVTNLVIDITIGFNCTGLLSMTQDLTVLGDLTLQNAPSIQSNRILVGGDVVSNDADGYTNTTVVTLNGNTDQSVSGTGRLMAVEFAKSSGDVIFDTGFNRTFTTLLVSTGQWDVLGNSVTASSGFTARAGKITGAGTLTGTMTITSSGTLGGAMTVNGNVTANNTGILAAGNSPGQITINGNLALNSGSILDVDINGSTPGTQHDQWVVNGTVTINAAILTGTVGGPLTTPITVIANNATDAIVGSRFTGAATNGGTLVIDGVTYFIYYQGDTGNDLVLEELQLPPTAGDDAYISLKDTTLTVVAGAGLLANDTDVDSAILTATVQTAPQNGVISLQANGSFVYTPTLGFLGTDVFTYTVSDGVLSDNGLVSIKVVRDSTAALQVSLPIAGWNLFGYPLQRTLPVTEALASIAGKYNRVFGYEPADPSSPWKMYDPTLQAPFDSLLNELTEMVFAQGYWLRTTEAVTLTLPGDNGAILAADAATLRALPPATLYGYLPSHLHAGQPVEAWIGATRCGVGVTNAVEDGRTAFAVHISAADSSTPSCGTVGRTVTLKLAGDDVLISTWDNGQAGFVDFTLQFTQPIYLPLIGKE